MPKQKPDIKVVAQEFGKAHKEEAEAKGRKDKYRKQFFDLIEIPEQELARKTIYIEGTADPEAYVASLYPKWRILKSRMIEFGDEWEVLIQEDPEKKNFVLVNPLDGQVYQRTVAESAPDVDLERLKAEHPSIYRSVTFQPKPPRELKPLNELNERQRETLMRYLLPVKLTDRMEKPRKPKPEELQS